MPRPVEFMDGMANVEVRFGASVGRALMAPDNINGGWRPAGDHADAWLTPGIVDAVMRGPERLRRDAFARLANEAASAASAAVRP